jgi:hypothetical protein
MNIINKKSARRPPIGDKQMFWREKVRFSLFLRQVI